MTGQSFTFVLASAARQKRPKSWKPHITLFRNAQVSSLSWDKARKLRWSFTPLQVHSLALVESQLGRKGPRYIPLREITAPALP